MLVTQVDNRRLRKARLTLAKLTNSDIRMLGKLPTLKMGSPLMSQLKKLSWHLDQQSARLARFIHRPSFAGVPAAPPAQYRHSFMTKWGDLTDITKAELPYKERRERYLEEIKRNLNSWHGLPPRPYRGPRAKRSPMPKCPHPAPCEP